MYGNDDYVDQVPYDMNGYSSPADHDPVEGREDPNYEQPFYTNIPDGVKKFLIYLRDCINEGVVYEVSNLYETTFPRLTEQYFDKTPWPEVGEIKYLVNCDPVFLILYRELYYRHIYAHVQGGPSLAQRFDSYATYCELFNYIINASEPVPLDLPDIWLWELIDEFVYQYQSFSQFRASPLKRTPEELEALNQNNQVWNVLCVLNVLCSLVEKSNIKRQLEVHASGGDADSVAGDFGRYPLYKKLGYFSLVGLLRLHSLCGDYYLAIRVLDNIELHRKSQFSYVPACQITVSYYVGFAYMMMRRYSDAIRTFTSILLYIQRTKQLFQSRSYQNDQINKQTEQMYHLLAICLVLHPQYVDEAIQQVLRDKNYHEKMFKMQCGELAEFEACFAFACPKFLAPAPPVDAPADDYVKDPITHQIQVFMDEVKQQKMIPTIRSFLKLYTTLPLGKLAMFLSSERERGGDSNKSRSSKADIEELITQLLCFKHKMKNIVWTKGTSGLDGIFQSGSELDFYMDGDMIHIADTTVSHRYADFFIRKILKFQELNRKLHMIKI